MKNDKLNFLEKIVWFFTGMVSWLFGLMIYNELKYSNLERHKQINSYLFPGVVLGTILYLVLFILNIL